MGKAPLSPPPRAQQHHSGHALHLSAGLARARSPALGLQHRPARRYGQLRNLFRDSAHADVTRKRDHRIGRHQRQPHREPELAHGTGRPRACCPGLKRIREVAEASEITVGPEVAPGANVTSDAQLLAFIKETVVPIYHAVATCRTSCACDEG